MFEIVDRHTDDDGPRLEHGYTISSPKSIPKGGGVAQWLGRQISDQGVPGSNPGRCTFRCGLEQVTFTLLSTG